MKRETKANILIGTAQVLLMMVGYGGLMLLTEWGTDGKPLAEYTASNILTVTVGCYGVVGITRSFGKYFIEEEGE